MLKSKATRSSSIRLDIAMVPCAICLIRKKKCVQGINCNHTICTDCINHQDAERRSNLDVATGPYLPCPVLSCDGVGQFKVPEQAIDLTLSDDEYEYEGVDVVASSTIKQECSLAPEKCKSEYNDGMPSVLSSSPVAEDSIKSAVRVTPAPVKSEQSDVKMEHNDTDVKFEQNNAYDYDTDDGSRFSQGEDIKPIMKKETDDEGSDDESRFSKDSSDHIDDDEVEKSKLKADPEQQIIKEEPTYANLELKQAKNDRKYGDRVLLARQSKDGMMKLGGGNQASHLHPVNPEERKARMGGRYALAYNILWNFDAPRYAGQKFASVTMYPREHGYDPTKTPFSVFVMRRKGSSTIGWEYCGEYKLQDQEDELEMATRADSVSYISKNCIANDIKRSLSNVKGEWHNGIAYWRERVVNECLDNPNSLSSVKARALGLDSLNLSNMEFVDQLVHFDDFYNSHPIEFVGYDDAMYNFVKRGKTTKNKNNNKRAPGEPAATAQDWYNIMDQQLEGGDRKEKKQRKRKHSYA